MGTLALAQKYAGRKNLFLQREIAVSLRGVPFQDCRLILEKLIDGYDGRNRYYLEALGVAFHGKEKQVYEEYGLETAEEANQPTLKEFGITIKELI